MNVPPPSQGSTPSRSGPKTSRWLALGLVALAACQPRVRRTADDVLVVLVEDEVRDIDPRFAITNYDTKLSRLVCPGLTTVDDPSLEPQLALAESIAEVEPLVWEARLRPDVVFSDGTPVTSADVVFTFATTLDPEFGSLYQRGFDERFARVEAVDARRVRFHLRKPVATLLSDLDFGILAKSGADERGRYSDDRPPLCAGPFVVTRKEPERVLLARNDRYWGERAKMPRIEVRTVRDQSARTMMLAGGSADLVQNAVRVDLVGEVGQRKRLRVDSGPGAILTYLMMNNDHPVLGDVRVRRAIALAVDRETIVAAKFDGRAKLATGLLPESHWAYAGDVDRYGYDPDRARALLDEAGYPDPDGPGGQPRLRLTYKTSANQFRLALARIIAAQLGEVGIEVEVRSFEFGTFFTDIKQGNFELASMQTAAITEPDYLYSYFHSSRIPSQEDPNAGNRWHYRSAELDELVAKGRTVMDRETRRALYRDAQKVLARDLPIVPLWHEDVIAITNIDVSGYQILPSARFAGLATATKKKRGL